MVRLRPPEPASAPRALPTLSSHRSRPFGPVQVSCAVAAVAELLEGVTHHIRKVSGTVFGRCHLPYLEGVTCHPKKDRCAPGRPRSDCIHPCIRIQYPDPDTAATQVSRSGYSYCQSIRTLDTEAFQVSAKYPSIHAARGNDEYGFIFGISEMIIFVY